MITVIAIAVREGARTLVKSPQPGWFEPAIAHGDAIVPGRALGTLRVLERRVQVVAPDVRGVANATNELARAVGYGDVLVEVVAQEHARATPSARESPTISDLPTAKARGLVFRAPTSGRFYARPAADKPPYVTVGAELVRGATVCLLEVMKTFNRVTYGGGGLPERARVKELLVTDGADVNAGEPLLVLEAL